MDPHSRYKPGHRRFSRPVLRRIAFTQDDRARLGLLGQPARLERIDAEETLRSAYRAFNARDIEAVVELMHADVDWPNAWEGGRVVGRAAVTDYWTRQFAAISSNVEPEGFTREPDGSITVDVHQVVHDAQTGELLSDARVRHRYRLEDGLIARMDVLS